MAQTERIAMTKREKENKAIADRIEKKHSKISYEKGNNKQPKRVRRAN